MASKLDELLQRREEALQGILKVVERMDRELAIAVVLSWLPLEEVEELDRRMNWKDDNNGPT